MCVCQYLLLPTQCCVAVQLLESDVDAHHSNVDHIVECRQMSDTSTSVAVSANADSLADTCRRYDSLTSDIDSRLLHLSELEPRWKQFDGTVSDIREWLKTHHDQVQLLHEEKHGSAVSQALLQCQVCCTCGASVVLIDPWLGVRKSIRPVKIE